MNKPNNPNISYVSKDDILTLLFDYLDRAVSTNDLACWLETRTNMQFTVVQIKFIREVFEHLDSINARNNEFKNKWLAHIESAGKGLL